MSLCIAEVTGQHLSGHVLAVGTVVDMRVQPRGCGGGYIRLYNFTEGGELELLHKTKVGMKARVVEGLLLAAGSRRFDWDSGSLRFHPLC